MTAGGALALLLASATALTACGGPPKAEAQPEADTRLTDAHTACLSQLGAFENDLTLTDEGQTLLVDTNPDNTAYGDALGGLICVLNYLQTPQSVVAKIECTNALMGVEASHDGLAYSWTYHPDTGAELIVTAGAR